MQRFFVAILLILIGSNIVSSWPWSTETKKEETTKKSSSAAHSPAKRPTSTWNATMYKSYTRPTTGYKRTDNSSITPAKHPYDYVFYRKISDHISKIGNISKLVFLGDSLIHRATRNTSLWEPLETKYGAVSLVGIGDRTENIISRLSKGFLKNITSNPLVVIMAGGSNAAVGDSPVAIFNGIQKIVEYVKKDLPKSDILLLGMIPNPRGGGNKTYEQVNQQIRQEYPSDSQSIASKHVQFIDISKYFVNQNLTINKALYGPDNIHPNSNGYEVIMRSLDPYFAKLPNLNLPPRPKSTPKRYTFNSTVPVRIRSNRTASGQQKLNFTQSSEKSKQYHLRANYSRSKPTTTKGKFNISSIVVKEKVK